MILIFIANHITENFSHHWLRLRFVDGGAKRKNKKQNTNITCKIKKTLSMI